MLRSGIPLLALEILVNGAEQFLPDPTMDEIVFFVDSFGDKISYILQPS